MNDIIIQCSIKGRYYEASHRFLCSGRLKIRTAALQMQKRIQLSVL